jgi:hypothetical protein
MNWTELWHAVGPEAQGLVAELEREVGPGHPLAGVRVVAVARRDDRDDVLFLLPEAGERLARVHLTWSGRRETDPRWPHTLFYEGWDDWTERGIATDDDE